MCWLPHSMKLVAFVVSTSGFTHCPRRSTWIGQVCVTGVLGVSYVAGVLGVGRGDRIPTRNSTFSDFELVHFLLRTHFRVRYLSSYVYPGIWSMGIPNTRVSIDGRI